MLGKKSIDVNSDGQIVVTERFISDEVILQLDRKASLALAAKVLKAQGYDVPKLSTSGA